MYRPCSLGLVLLTLLCAGCVGPSWDGKVARFGELRDINLGSDGSIALSQVPLTSLSVGLGARDGFSGEILIHDGQVWSSSASAEHGIETAADPFASNSAALLYLTQVPRWRTFAIEEPLALMEMPRQLYQMAYRHWIDLRRPFPFQLRGTFRYLRVHVSDEAGAASRPLSPERFVHSEYRNVEALLVGFHAFDREGVFTEYGRRLHVHALVFGEEPFVGHVDEAIVAAGSLLRIPAVVPRAEFANPSGYHLTPWFNPPRPAPAAYHPLEIE